MIEVISAFAPVVLHDYGADQLDAIKQMIDAEKSDLYDVLAYIAFAMAPETREERVSVRKPNIMANYDAH